MNKPLTGLVIMQVCKRRTGPAAKQASSEPQDTTIIPSVPLIRARKDKESENSSSEGDEMTAEEQLQMNEELASLGIPPLAMDSIPIAIVHGENIPRDETPQTPIQVLSDSEERNADQGAPDEAKNQPANDEQTLPADDITERPLGEIDPAPAIATCSDMVNLINPFPGSKL
jgi:hypothetical protein